MIQLVGGLCWLRLGPPPALAASNGDRESPAFRQSTIGEAHWTAARPLRVRLPWAIGRSPVLETDRIRPEFRGSATASPLLFQESGAAHPCGVNRSVRQQIRLSVSRRSVRNQCLIQSDARRPAVVPRLGPIPIEELGLDSDSLKSRVIYRSVARWFNREAGRMDVAHCSSTEK